MKKFLAIAVSAVFLLGFAASAFAIHAEIPTETQAVVAKGVTQITLGGSIRVRGEMRNNTTDFDDDANDSSSLYDQRVRLSLDAKVSDDVQGFVMVEGGSDTSDTYTWGESSSAATGIYTVGNAKRGSLNILEAWILYKNDLANLKVGHMPLALGNKIFFDHGKFGDDAIILYKDVDNLHLAALTIKLDESGGTTATTVEVIGDAVGDDDGVCEALEACVTTASPSSASTTISDDADAYVALFTYKGDNYNLGGDVTWVNDNKFAGVAGIQADLYNIGLRGDLKVTDNVKLMADVEFQTGDAEGLLAGNLAALGCGTVECDFGGYAFMLGASAKLDPVTVDLTIGQGSGDDNATATDNDIDTFVTSLSSGIPYVGFVYGTRATHVTGAANAGYANTTFVKGSVSGKPAEKMTAKADIIWLAATDDVATTTDLDGDGYCDAGDTCDDDLGFEIDGTVTYDLAKNLKYWVEGGYFFVGDVYKINATKDGDDAYALRHGIELTF